MSVVEAMEGSVVDESPEQILARLEQYVATMRQQSPAPAVDNLIPSWSEPPDYSRRFVHEVAPALVAVSICAAVILIFEFLAHTVAVVLIAALVLVGAFALWRQVPYARAWAVGLVVAALLIRFS
jgi:hypothetical protein